ncbi:MAG: 50S ribosomal protein L4 [Candidatus Gracilibacteria bacterium]|nr:50S ribosomal protein L4 [Candidatus Gracilibacteria bacterium]
MKIDIYDQNGKKIGDQTLNSEIFETEVNEGLVHLALVRQLSNSRNAIAKTKNRAARRGGGIKPFKQKGTGNARAGSRRSPIWRKGGVIFGPTGLENFQKNMPKSERRKALCCALSAKAKDNEILGLDGYKGEIKTKAFSQMLTKLPITRNVLIVIPEKDAVIQKSAHNLTEAKVILVNYLNIADLLKYKTLLFLKDSLSKVDELWGKAAVRSDKNKESKQAEKKEVKTTRAKKKAN